MLTPEQTTALRPKLFSIQLVAGALIAGAILFAAVIAAITDWNNFNDRFKLLSLIGTVSGILVLGLSLIVPKVFASGDSDTLKPASNAQSAINDMIGSLTVETLIRFALIESAIMLNLMVVMIEPHRASLVIVGIGVLMMLIWFPRQSKMIATIEDRLRFPHEDPAQTSRR